MWSSSLLVLLLFAVVMRTTSRSPSTVPNRTLPYPHPSRSPRLTPTLMQELLGPDGGKRTLKAYNGAYLSEYGRLFAHSWVAAPGQYWIIQQINDNEVALKSNGNGEYITHWWFGKSGTAEIADEWEMLTPVKNNDGTWSFKSRWNKWLSAVSELLDVNGITFESGNGYTALMDELLGPNGGKRLLKAYNGLYLTEDMAHRRAITRGWRTWRKVETHYWTIWKINEKEVALRSSEGKFISHDYFAAATLKDRVSEWELLTPVKNDDGTWSFKSRFDKWLSGSRKDAIAGFMPENNACERWRLESWE